MTHQAIKLLRLLIRAQKHESNIIRIDPDEFYAETGDVVHGETTKVDLQEYRTSLWPTIQYLIDENKIKCLTPNHYRIIQVNHDGWYYFKNRSHHMLLGILKFILCSIVIPIIVTIVTNLLINVIY